MGTVTYYGSVTENEVKEKYERDTIPDPNQYFVKDYPYYTGFTGYTGYNYPTCNCS